MNLLYNLVAVQPIHNAKFHGGGSYGEVVFFALLRKLFEGAESLSPDVCLCAVFNSKKWFT